MLLLNVIKKKETFWFSNTISAIPGVSHSLDLPIAEQPVIIENVFNG